MPIFYECQRCTACCRWPGQVRLTGDEITRLAQWQGMSGFDFIQKYTRLAQDRRGLALQEKPGGECVFLDGNDCSVQPVKPQQCRDFPNLWNFPGFEKVCRAMPHLLGNDEYARRIHTATGANAIPAALPHPSTGKRQFNPQTPTGVCRFADTRCCPRPPGWR